MAGRIVILGAGGLLGQVLTRRARSRGHEVLALSSSQCDITDPAAVRGYLARGVVAINCAAYTKVDDAETDAARAFEVNATGAGNIARSCAEVGAQLVHVSTDYVFGGDRRTPYDTDQPTGPLSVYGRSKLAGEGEVLAALPTARVVRTSWVYGGTVDGTDFVSVMRRKAAGSDEVQVVDDQVGSPTYVADLADALVDVADGAGTAAVLHAANGGAASRFEQARAVFELLGADPQRVRPVPGAQFPRPAPRPAFSALSARRSTAAGLAPLRPWRDALAAALTGNSGNSGTVSNVANITAGAVTPGGPLTSTP